MEPVPAGALSRDDVKKNYKAAFIVPPVLFQKFVYSKIGLGLASQPGSADLTNYMKLREILNVKNTSPDVTMGRRDMRNILNRPNHNVIRIHYSLLPLYLKAAVGVT